MGNRERLARRPKVSTFEILLVIAVAVVVLGALLLSTGISELLKHLFMR